MRVGRADQRLRRRTVAAPADEAEAAATLDALANETLSFVVAAYQPAGAFARRVAAAIVAPRQAPHALALRERICRVAASIVSLVEYDAEPVDVCRAACGAVDALNWSELDLLVLVGATESLASALLRAHARNPAVVIVALDYGAGSIAEVRGTLTRFGSSAVNVAFFRPLPPVRFAFRRAAAPRRAASPRAPPPAPSSYLTSVVFSPAPSMLSSRSASQRSPTSDDDVSRT